MGKKIREALETLKVNSIGLAQEHSGITSVEIENETLEAYEILEKALRKAGKL